MTTAYQYEGATITYTEPGSANVPAGTLVQAGAYMAVTLEDIAQGGSGAAALEGVWRLPKAYDEAYPDDPETPTPPDESLRIAQGTRLCWGNTEQAFVNDRATAPAGAENGDLRGPCFVAWEAAGPLDASVLVRLDVSPVTVTSGIA